MATDSEINVSIALPFPKAGLTFRINVAPSTNGTGSTQFALGVTDGNDRSVPLTVDACPPLADWVRGYTRWLRRANVTASHDETGITGTFDEGLTVEQVLRGLQDACDMVRQRFDMYEEPVLA